MELNEFKNRVRKIGVPDHRFDDTHPASQSPAEFISAMRAEDQRDRARVRRVMLFCAVAGVFYVLLFALTWIAPPDNDPGFHRFLLSAFALLMLSAALVTRLRANELAGIDYAQPIGSFLRSVERRYKPINMRDTGFGIVYVVAFSVTGALGWLSGKDRYFPSMDQGTALLLYCGILAAALVVGLIVGVNEWKKRKAPFLRQIRRMISDLEAPGPETVNGEQP